MGLGAGPARRRCRGVLRAVRVPAVPLVVRAAPRGTARSVDRSLPVEARPAAGARLRHHRRRRPHPPPRQRRRGTARVGLDPPARSTSTSTTSCPTGSRRCGAWPRRSRSTSSCRHSCGWHSPGRGRWRGGSDRVGVVVAAMVATTVVWLLDLSVRLDSGDTMIRLWLPSYLTWFAVGLVLARTVSRARRRDPGARGRLTVLLQELGRSPGLCWLSAAALFAIAATPVAGPADLTPPTLGAALTKNLLYAAIAGLVVLPGVFAPAGGRFARVLSRPALRHLGHLSYGIFCVHLLLLELITDWRDMPLFAGRGVELFALTLLASVVVSEVLYRAVERPSQRLRNLRPPWAAPSRARRRATPSPAAGVRAAPRPSRPPSRAAAASRRRRRPAAGRPLRGPRRRPGSASGRARATAAPRPPQHTPGHPATRPRVSRPDTGTTQAATAVYRGGATGPPRRGATAPSRSTEQEERRRRGAPPGRCGPGRSGGPASRLRPAPANPAATRRPSRPWPRHRRGSRVPPSVHVLPQRHHRG